MAVATTLQDYLESHRVAFEVIEHPHTNSTLRTAESAHISGNQLAKPVLLGDESSYLLAIIPATHRLEIDRFIRRQLTWPVLVSFRHLISKRVICLGIP